MQRKSFSEITRGYAKTEIAPLPLEDYVGDLSLRWERMNGFLERIVSKYNRPHILDLALGGGQDSMMLLKRGYDVISNEFDQVYLDQAAALSKKENVRFTIRRITWQQMFQHRLYQDHEFDVAFSLGNSFPNYLLSANDRAISLRNFWRALKPGGTLVFDTRNFDYMEREAEFILQDPEKNFRYLGQTTYLNKNVVRGFPVDITSDRIRFMWKHRASRRYATLDLWAATGANVQKMVVDSIGNVPITKYFDYQDKRPAEYDFVQYVLERPGTL